MARIFLGIPNKILEGPFLRMFKDILKNTFWRFLAVFSKKIEETLERISECIYF